MFILVFVLAHQNGYFEAELIPVQVKGKKGIETISFDEHPRSTSLEKLSTLAAVFKENGTVTAGNASVSIYGNGIYVHLV